MPARTKGPTCLYEGPIRTNPACKATLSSKGTNPLTFISSKGLRIAELVFQSPYLRCADYHVIALAVMRLLMKYGYSTVFDRGKFTIGYRLKQPTGGVNFTIGPAISLNDPSGNAVPNKQVYVNIMRLVSQKAEEYSIA